MSIVSLQKQEILEVSGGYIYPELLGGFVGSALAVYFGLKSGLTTIKNINCFRGNSLVQLDIAGPLDRHYDFGNAILIAGAALIGGLAGLLLGPDQAKDRQEL